MSQANGSSKAPKLQFKGLVSILVMLGLICFGPILLSISGGPLQNFGAVSAASDPVIAAAGDIACDPTNANFKSGNGTSNNCRQKYTSDLLVNAGLAAVLNLGDNQYYCGGYQAYVQSYDLSWGRVKSITYPSVGNHEYLTSGGTDCSPTANAAGYFQYFGASAGNGYYSFDIGTWHLISLDSNCSSVGGCGASSPQGKWLEADLTAHTNFCTLAFWHIPLYSSGGRANANSQNFWNSLYNHNADLILAGHDHIYERFAPQTSTGAVDPVRGIREFLAGTGGADHTSIVSIAANSEVRDASTFGVLKLTLHPTSYDWQFIPEAGKTFTDSGTTACHGSTGQPSPTPVATPTATALPATATPTATALPATATPTATALPATATPTATALPASATPTATALPATATATATGLASPTPTATRGLITIGETSILANDDSGNGNLLVAQQVSLSQTATIQSLSFYVASASGNLRLGIYDDAGGKPQNLKAQTAAFTPVAGWNTQNVVSQVSLPAGTYWLAYLPQSDNLHFKIDTSGTTRFYNFTYGALPAAFSSSPQSGTFHWSFYASLITGP